MRQIVLSLLVDNNPGVLARVAALFSRRGYNIDSITAGITNDPKYTRITVAVSGDNQILEQIRNQIAKLVPVRRVHRTGAQAPDSPVGSPLPSLPPR